MYPRPAHTSPSVNSGKEMSWDRIAEQNVQTASLSITRPEYVRIDLMTCKVQPPLPTNVLEERAPVLFVRYL